MSDQVDANADILRTLVVAVDHPAFSNNYHTVDQADVGRLLYEIKSKTGSLRNYNPYQHIGSLVASGEFLPRQEEVLSQLAIAIGQSVLEQMMRLVPALRIGIDPKSDLAAALAKADFDVLERIWTAVGAEMGRRGENTKG